SKAASGVGRAEPAEVAPRPAAEVVARRHREEPAAPLHVVPVVVVDEIRARPPLGGTLPRRGFGAPHRRAVWHPQPVPYPGTVRAEAPRHGPSLLLVPTPVLVVVSLEPLATPLVRQCDGLRLGIDD